MFSVPANCSLLLFGGDVVLSEIIKMVLALRFRFMLGYTFECLLCLILE